MPDLNLPAGSPLPPDGTLYVGLHTSDPHDGTEVDGSGYARRPVLPDHSIEHSGFVPVGPRLMARSCRVDETRESASWLEDWSWTLQNAIADHDAWGLFGVAPDGDVRLFDVSPAGVVDCSRWAVEARILLPVRMAPTSALVRAVLRWVDDDGDHADDLLVDAVAAWQRAVSVTDRRHLEVPT